MAGSIVVTPTEIGAGVTKYSVAWTADGSGNVNTTAFGIRRGHVQGVKFIAGTPTPTTGYAASLLDADGADVLAGCGTAVAVPGAKWQAPIIGNATLAALCFCEVGNVIPTISGAGVAAQGVMNIFVGP